MTSQRIITLTTDFGLSDAYVAIMKGVILGIAPAVRIVDVSHDVQPQNVAIAGRLIADIYPYFPSNAIHIAVVDPGVGTGRKPLALSTAHGLYVGPDNGIFFPALAAQGGVDVETGTLVGTTGVVLTNSTYWRESVSQTFHGRDIFAPVGAHLSLGIPIRDVGIPLDSIELANLNLPVRKGNWIRGEIISIDRFGNAISNVLAHELSSPCTIEVGGRVLQGLASSYQDAPIVAVVGSTGRVEIAARNGKAAAMLGLNIGDAIFFRTGA